ncbi:MAG: aminodeoxychorismate/anthranilate synthase component II [Cyanobacteria bacterium J06628_6]
MILVIDNYDSFTYNLVQYLGELGQTLPVARDIKVFRNDKITLDEIKALAPDGIVISPGPGTPDDSGVSLDIIRELGPSLPILGVCLGHQSIGQVYGGKITAAAELMHGKTSPVTHTGVGVFAGLAQPLTATRYHSLVIDRDTLPPCLEITAWVEDGTIMGVRHRDYPHLEGVQFHPESVLTQSGKQLLKNFLMGLKSPVAEGVGIRQ